MFFMPFVERSTPEVVAAQASLLDTAAGLLKILNGAPLLAMVVNQERQIVFANQRLVDFVGAAGPGELYGLRPGEVLSCIHWSETGNGCGTSEWCSVCGALRAMVGAQLGEAQVQACRIRRRAGSAEEVLELEVSASPFSAGGQQFTILFATSVRDRVRGEFIEMRILPEAGELARETEILARGLGRERNSALGEKMAAALGPMTSRLGSLLRQHSDLLAVEGGEVGVRNRELNSLAVAGESARDLRLHRAAEGIEIRIEAGAEDVPFTSDPGLVGRILAAFLLNALEAAPSGSGVTLGCRRSGDFVEFTVRDAGCMPRPVQLQVFSPGFSTKGPGRGFGTYSAMLIAERFLGGSVSFHSAPREGTTFLLRLPIVAAGVGE